MTRSAEAMNYRAPLLALLLCLSVAACSTGPTRSGSARRSPPPSSAPRSAPSAPSASAPQQPAAPVTVNPNATDKGDPDQRFKAALQLMKDKDNKEAQAAFTALALDYPTLSGPMTNLAILSSQSRQRGDALSQFQKAVTLNPRNAVAQNWLGTLYAESKDYTRAEQAYKAAIAQRADYAAAHLNLALLYDNARRPQDAIREYREYQKLSGNSNPMIDVWIKELESPAAPAGAAK